jgi:hypothetical protein
MILGRFIDVVVWEAVVLSGPGLYVPWQTCFSSGNIGAGPWFGHSGPQPVILPILISFCELIPGSEFFWHSAKWGWCAYMLYLEIRLFQSRVGVHAEFWVYYLLYVNASLVEMTSVCELTDLSRWGMQRDLFHNVTELHHISPQLSEDCLKLQLQY